MTDRDNSMSSIIAEAERRGNELEELEKRNRRRKAKGRKPIPTPQERADKEIRNKLYRSGDPTTVDSADALKLFEIRKAAMDDERAAEDPYANLPDDKDVDDVPPPESRTCQFDRAVEFAEEARRVQDLVAGAEGDKTILPKVDIASFMLSLEEAKRKKETWKIDDANGTNDSSKATQGDANDAKPNEDAQLHASAKQSAFGSFGAFVSDLYSRLGQSFDAVEHSIAELKASLNLLSSASRKAEDEKKPKESDGRDEFNAMLSKKTPVVFDVGGTKMSFDAVCVFHAPPCITVVSKAGSAKITPKPGAQLSLSYDMGGKRYESDPVTFLGTRFDLPMFGLSFVGFIRDREADVIDTAAGAQQETSTGQTGD